jgi:hypothetical protein
VYGLKLAGANNCVVIELRRHGLDKSSVSAWPAQATGVIRSSQGKQQWQCMGSAARLQACYQGLACAFGRS